MASFALYGVLSIRRSLRNRPLSLGRVTTPARKMSSSSLKVTSLSKMASPLAGSPRKRMTGFASTSSGLVWTISASLSVKSSTVSRLWELAVVLVRWDIDLNTSRSKSRVKKLLCRGCRWGETLRRSRTRSGSVERAREEGRRGGGRFPDPPGAGEGRCAEWARKRRSPSRPVAPLR